MGCAPHRQHQARRVSQMGAEFLARQDWRALRRLLRVGRSDQGRRLVRKKHDADLPRQRHEFKLDFRLTREGIMVYKVAVLVAMLVGPFDPPVLTSMNSDKNYISASACEEFRASKEFTESTAALRDA